MKRILWFWSVVIVVMQVPVVLHAREVEAEVIIAENPQAEIEEILKTDVSTAEQPVFKKWTAKIENYINKIPKSQKAALQQKLDSAMERREEYIRKLFADGAKKLERLPQFVEQFSANFVNRDPETSKWYVEKFVKFADEKKSAGQLAVRREKVNDAITVANDVAFAEIFMENAAKQDKFLDAQQQKNAIAKAEDLARITTLYAIESTAVLLKKITSKIPVHVTAANIPELINVIQESASFNVDMLVALLNDLKRILKTDGHFMSVKDFYRSLKLLTKRAISAGKDAITVLNEDTIRANINNNTPMADVITAIGDVTNWSDTAMSSGQKAKLKAQVANFAQAYQKFDAMVGKLVDVQGMKEWPASFRINENKIDSAELEEFIKELEAFHNKVQSLG